MAWEIHRVDEILAEKKKHKRQQEQVKAVRLLRNQFRPTRLVAWALRISTTTLIDWDQHFDENLCPYRKEETRGKSTKVTSGIVRQIVDQAKKKIARKERILIEQFTENVNKGLDITLGAETIREVLIANDLWAVNTRERRPLFLSKSLSTDSKQPVEYRWQ